VIQDEEVGPIAIDQGHVQALGAIEAPSVIADLVQDGHHGGADQRLVVDDPD
jgi:hypothetical protein